MSYQLLIQFLTVLAFRAPALIVLLVGIFLSLAWMKRYPGVSILACIAFLLFSMTTVGSAITNSVLPILMYQYGYLISGNSNLVFVIEIVFTVINIAAWVMILMAIFRGRNQIVVSRSGSSETVTNLPA